MSERYDFIHVWYVDSRSNRLINLWHSTGHKSHVRFDNDRSGQIKLDELLKNEWVMAADINYSMRPVLQHKLLYPENYKTLQ